MTKYLLHIEGFVVLMLALYFYAQTEIGWGWFFLLLLAPDLSMFGYMVNKKIGSYVYNLFHTYSLPLLLIILTFSMHQELLVAMGIIWVAHIGMDRMFGYGLKYATDFKSTHLNKI
ncbi:DUF4260 domain-containing protein [Virgibacillus necropolis]|uniref:DUF4260 domain-containing protein n=1 Tax=Virgibacillus necropolis TaxID=163877 RepID=UPI0038501EAB